jgi:hypothetical protein
VILAERVDSFIMAKLATANALADFCIAYEVRDPGWEEVLNCRDALERGDLESAYNHFEAVPLGGNGCFNDWQPNQSHFSNEREGNNLMHTFRALTERWCRFMKIAKT